MPLPRSILQLKRIAYSVAAYAALMLGLVLAPESAGHDALAGFISPTASAEVLSPPVDKPAQIADAELPYEVLALNRGETFNLFSMGKKVWSDTGRSVKVFVLPSRHPLHKQFAKQKIGSFPHVLNAIWDRHVYSGSGQRPTEVKDEREMQEAISTTQGAIGYLRDPQDENRIILIRNK